MPKHVHLPPIPPYLPVAPLEKKERARRKAKVGIDKDGTSEAKTEGTTGAQKAPPPAENPVHSTNPLATASGALPDTTPSASGSAPGSPSRKNTPLIPNWPLISDPALGFA